VRARKPASGDEFSIGMEAGGRAFSRLGVCRRELRALAECQNPGESALVLSRY
jgi:hypothetical protein